MDWLVWAWFRGRLRRHGRIPSALPAEPGLSLSQLSGTHSQAQASRDQSAAGGVVFAWNLNPQIKYMCRCLSSGVVCSVGIKNGNGWRGSYPSFKHPTFSCWRSAPNSFFKSSPALGFGRVTMWDTPSVRLSAQASLLSSNIPECPEPTFFFPKMSVWPPKKGVHLSAYHTDVIIWGVLCEISRRFSFFLIKC